MTGEFAYEVRPCLQEWNGIAMCDESDADFWGLYERPTTPDDHGNCLAVWVAGFARREDAMVFRDILIGEEP